MFDESFHGSFEHDTVAVFIFQKEFVEFGFHFHFYFFFYASRSGQTVFGFRKVRIY